MDFKGEKEFLQDIDQQSLQEIEGGKGGFGIVRKGRLLANNEECAIKFLETDDPAVSKLFVEEAKTLTKIVPNKFIIKTLGLYKWDKQDGKLKIFVFRLVMEKADKSLFDTIKYDYENYNNLQVLTWLRQTLEGLFHLKQKCNLFHRDIKPQNLLLKNNKILLADFGISVRYDSFTNMPSSKGIAGTTFFGSPEYNLMLLNKRSHYDYEKNDVWSLGFSFMIIALKEPQFPHFKDLNREEKMKDLKSFLDQVDHPKLQVILTKMLSYNDQLRPTFKEIIDEIDMDGEEIKFDSDQSRIKKNQQNQLNPDQIIQQNGASLQDLYKYQSEEHKNDKGYNFDELQQIKLSNSENQKRNNDDINKNSQQWFQPQPPQSHVNIIEIEGEQNFNSYIKNSKNPGIGLFYTSQNISEQQKYCNFEKYLRETISKESQPWKVIKMNLSLENNYFLQDNFKINRTSLHLFNNDGQFIQSLMEYKPQEIDTLVFLSTAMAENPDVYTVEDEFQKEKTKKQKEEQEKQRKQKEEQEKVQKQKEEQEQKRVKQEKEQENNDPLVIQNAPDFIRKVYENDQAVLVFFYEYGSSICECALSELIVYQDDISYANKKYFSYYKVNITNPICAQLNVEKTPTFILFQQKEIFKILQSNNITQSNIIDAIKLCIEINSPSQEQQTNQQQQQQQQNQNQKQAQPQPQQQNIPFFIIFQQKSKGQIINISTEQQYTNYVNEHIIKQKKPFILEFYVDWSDNSKRLIQNVEKYYFNDSNGWDYLRIDCDNPRTTKLKEHFKVERVPWICLFEKGKGINKFEGCDFNRIEYFFTLANMFYTNKNIDKQYYQCASDHVMVEYDKNDKQLQDLKCNMCYVEIKNTNKNGYRCDLCNFNVCTGSLPQLLESKKKRSLQQELDKDVLVKLLGLMILSEQM